MENQIEFETNKLVADVEPIEESSSWMIKTLEDVTKKIEEPLQEGTIELIQKGVQTLSSSANKKDISVGYGHIILDYESLSQENKKVVDEQKYGIIEDFGSNTKVKAVEIKIPLDSSTTQEEFIENLKKQTNFFKKQPVEWIPVYSTDQIMSQYGYGLNEKELFFKENPNGIEGYYFDKENDSFYPSKWLYDIKKRNENIT